MPTAPSAKDSEIRAAWQARDYATATQLVLRSYGPEIYSLLAAQLPSADDATEVFSEFAERFWTGLPRFEWRCSARTYCYVLARNAANDYQRRPANRRKNRIALSQVEHLSEVVAELRTQTAVYLRTETKDRFRKLREALSADDQLLLILRVDRSLDWTELAMVWMGAEPSPSEAELKRESARLRKRFQLLKAELRRLAEADGLL